ncbi:MAG: ADP-ribosylglycohydrolase family protein, partial [Alphaproteobacteria bacterium]
MVDGPVGPVCRRMVRSRGTGDDRSRKDRSSMTKLQNTGPAFQSRVRGLLHGVAFGDAIGAPVEKLTPAEIRSMYGRVNSLDNQWHRTLRVRNAGMDPFAVFIFEPGRGHAERLVEDGVEFGRVVRRQNAERIHLTIAIEIGLRHFGEECRPLIEIGRDRK